MTGFRPGDSVRVHIGGIDNDPIGHAGVHFPSAEVTTSRVDVEIARRVVSYPVEWVVPVAPPYPWTEIGTLVQIDGGYVYRLEIPTGRPQLWWDIVENMPVDWATDIAPYNPVRLVPEQTAAPALVTRSSIPWLHVHDGLYASAATLASRKQIEAIHGPVTEVDDPAVTS